MLIPQYIAFMSMPHCMNGIASTQIFCAKMNMEMRACAEDNAAKRRIVEALCQR